MALKIQFYNIRKNIAPILIALIIGIAFWFYTKTDAIITNRIKYPVKIKTTESLIMTNASPDSITLKVTGKIRLQRLLKRVTPTIKVPKCSPGFQTIYLEENDLKFPAYLRVKDFEIIDPDSITIRLDSIIEKKVIIILIKGIKSDPEKVTIKGPKSIIKDINYLFPDSIPVGNITTITLENKLIRVIPDRIRIKR